MDTTIVSDNFTGVLDCQDMMKRPAFANILLSRAPQCRSRHVDRFQGFIDTIENSLATRLFPRVKTLGQTEETMPQVKRALDEGLDLM